VEPERVPSLLMETSMTGLGRRGRSRVPNLLYLVFLGAVVGACAGLAETILMPLRGVSGVGGAGTVNVAVFYAIIWAAVGFLVGLLALASGPAGRARRDEGARRAFYGSLVATLAVLVLVGSFVNIELLPTMFARESLVFDAAVLVGSALLWLVLARVWRRALSRRAGRRHRSPLVFTALALVAVLVVVGAASREREAAGAPGGRVAAKGDLNILLVVVDALRADHLGCYGYTRQTSPNIDRMASEGVLFTRAHSQAPRTKESTASLVTSLYPSTHDVSRLGNVLPESVKTLTEMMRDAGLATALVSANPLVSPTFGFGRGADFIYSEAPSVLDRTILLRISRTLGTRFAFLRWIPRLMAATEKLLPTRGATYPFAGRDADRLNGAFLGWLDGLGDVPFFAYLHYMEPHAPYAPPPPFDEMFDPGYSGSPVTSYPAGESLMLPFVEGAPISAAERVNMVAQYDGSIAYFDREFGELLAGLAARGLSDRTLVIITSDHGEEFYDHHGWGHGQSLYEELIRVPLIVWSPGRLVGGRVVDDVVRHVDLLPTILGAAGAVETLDAPEFEGVNLWAMLRADADLGTELRVFAEVLSGGHFARALIDGQWKVIYTKFGASERVMLFDLAHDPGELSDLVGDRREVADAMLAELTRLSAAAASRKRESGTMVIDQQTEERLRALGYVQ
jgi:arylsulfatase A-like enzyme